MMDDLLERLEDLKRRRDQLARVEKKKMPPQKPRAPRGQSVGDAGGAVSARACFLCGQVGHIKRDCPQLASQALSQAAARRGGTTAGIDLPPPPAGVSLPPPPVSRKGGSQGGRGRGRGRRRDRRGRGGRGQVVKITIN